MKTPDEQRAYYLLHGTCREVLKYIIGHPNTNVTDMHNALELEQSTLSHVLMDLRKLKLVTSSVDKKRRLYTVNTDMVLTTIASIEAQLQELVNDYKADKK